MVKIPTLVDTFEALLWLYLSHEVKQTVEVPMEKVRLIIAGYWVATMLVYLLGDVLRIYSGDMVVGTIEGKPVTQGMWLFVAVIMLIPILMIPANLSLPMPFVKWLNLVVVPLVFIFNVIALPYKGHYDNFLIVVSLIFNVAVMIYAWKW